MSVLKKTKASLSLQDIRELGGTKDDLALLKGVDSDSASELEFNSEAEEGGEGDSGVVTTNEIQSFIQSLGLDSVEPTEETTIKKNKVKKEAIQGLQEAKAAVDEGAELPDKVDKRKGRKKKESAVTEATVSGGDDGSGEPLMDEGVNRQLRHLSVKSYKKLLVSMDSEEMWYDQAQSSGPAFPVTGDVIDHLLQVGEGLMKNELHVYEQVRQKRKGASEVRWLKTVLSSGTLSDKMAALTLLVQESPVHTLNSLDSLLSMASKKGKRECILAVDTLKELWITDLLPEGRKLKTLKQRPLNQLVPDGSHSLQQCHHTLLLWYYEHQLKNRYAQFLTVLKGLSHDTVANVREKMVGHIFDLLYQRPEQEQELLSQLVNKIGDPVKKIASKVILFVLKLLSHHVNMKVIVAMAIERLLHRPNIGQRAQYYAVCCLNQFTIGHDDEALAAKLIELFFTFFKLYVQRGQLDAKMLGALLTGVNRAFPFLKGDIPSFEDHLHSLFTVVHVGPLATGIQSLMLLFQVMESRSSVSGRYYQALYAKLMDPTLKHSGKQAMFLNLLFKSVKSDPEVNRVKAFLKRILQICSTHAPPFICGCLFLISEIVKHKPSLWSFILQSERSDEEHFTDVDTTTLPSFEATQSHSDDPEGGHVTTPGDHVTRGVGYRVAYRNPLYSGAEHTCLWELSQLTRHYHPSVQVFAKKISSGEYIDYRGDPLADFTLMRFLDRFICKNPKQKQSDHGGSVMQRTTKMAADPSSEILANSSQFASMDESKIRVDEVFMHRYFTQKAASETRKRKKKREKEEGEEGEERGGDMDVDRFSAESQSDSDMDFAGELERQARSNRKMSKKERRKKMEGSSDEESGGDLESIGGELSGSDDGLDYGALMSDDDSLIGAGVGGGEEGATAAEPTDAEMERLLLDNLSSGSELSDSEEEEKGPPRKKRKNKERFEQGGKFDTRSLFAAADEFAHLLEDSSGGYGGHGDVRRRDRASEKQLEWEERRAVPKSFGRRGRPTHRNKNKRKGQSANRPNSNSSGRNSQRRPQSKVQAGAKRTGKRSGHGNRQPRGRANRTSRRK